MKTSFEYYVEYFVTEGASSGHLPVMLAVKLNDHAAKGWRLIHMPSVSVGFLLVMERDKNNQT
jgi:hypothetical protein